MFNSIGNKINLVIGAVVAIALLVILVFYTYNQRENIMAQNERTMTKLTQAVSESLQTIMISGYADIAELFAERVHNVKDLHDFQIMRTNGNQAFKDNKTLNEVNERRGEEEFYPRDTETKVSILDANDPNLQQAIKTLQVSSYYEFTDRGERLLTYLSPIKNEKDCHKCHGSNHVVRGVVKLSTSMSLVDADIERTTTNAILVIVAALLGVFTVTKLLLNYAVVRPIRRMTDAMSEVSSGKIDQTVPIIGKDELSQMAIIFNQMSLELKNTYDGLEMEHDKLTTIIESAEEGIIVTNSLGDIVLINPAASRLLGKDNEQVIKEGFINILDDPLTILNQVSQSEKEIKNTTVEYKEHILTVSARTIFSSDGNRVGSAAMIRNITEEKLLENQLRELSTTDGLTRLFNRRYLDETLEQELTRASRYGINLSIMMFDVDHFKRFNDDHGHDQGDRVLQTIGLLMKNTCRDTDVPCRYGGEEFLIILPNTDKDGAMILAERLRHEIEITAVDGLHVTISIGVASYPNVEYAAYDKFIESADKALYVGKEAGRNCVFFAEE